MLRSEDLDIRGTSLWNLCTRLRRSIDSHALDTTSEVLLNARTFAFLLLDLAYMGGRNAAGNLTRLMRIGLKAAKNCLGMYARGASLLTNTFKEKRIFELAVRVLEKISVYEEVLTVKADTLAPEDRDGCQPLIAEYYVLRTALVKCIIGLHPHILI